MPIRVSVEELAAASCGDVSAAVAWAGGATSDLMLLRQTVRTFGAASGLAEQLVVEHGNATSVGRDASDATRTFVAALDAAGLAEALSGAQRDALARLDDKRHAVETMVEERAGHGTPRTATASRTSRARRAPSPCFDRPVLPWDFLACRAVINAVRAKVHDAV